MVFAAVLGVVLWLNYDQDIEISLRSSPDTGVYLEDIYSERHELCIRSQQEIVLAHGLWPIEARPSIMIGILGECLHTTTSGRLSLKVHLNDKFDQDILKNGRVCVLIHFAYLTSHDQKLRLKFSCA